MGAPILYFLRIFCFRVPDEPGYFQFSTSDYCLIGMDLNLGGVESGLDKLLLFEAKENT